MDPTMTTMFPKLDWDATVEAPLDIPQDVKTATDLPLDLGMSLPSQVPGTGALEASEWSDTSPSLGDSLLSLDFTPSENSPLELGVLDEPPMKRARMNQDFTLFPDPVPSISGGLHDSHASVFSLLENLDAKNSTQRTVEPSASPEDLMSASAPLPARPETGRRRRREPADLLPIDAPIQPRHYHAQSATSRRDDPSEDCEVATDQVDARTQKRLSNTLAARRSRHRKAEELKHLHDTINALRDEVAIWRGRYEELQARMRS